MSLADAAHREWYTEGCWVWTRTAEGSAPLMFMPSEELARHVAYAHNADLLAQAAPLQAATEVASPRPGGYDQAIHSTDGLVGFLYVLMRDHVPPGVVEGVVVEHIEAARAARRPEAQFSNDFLAAYAYELARRLQGSSPLDALYEAHDQLRAAQAQGTTDKEVGSGGS